MNFEVIEVTGCAGGECYIIKHDGKTSLCDSGFPFSAQRTAENIENALSGNVPDYILITHAHYDHVGGSPYLKEVFGNSTKLIASTLTNDILLRPGARKLMRELGAAAEKETHFSNSSNGRAPSTDRLDNFMPDIIINPAPNEAVTSEITAIAAPGHTRDTVGYYFEKLGLLVATETTGVIEGSNIIPTFITSYAQCLDAIKLMEEISAPYILTPHYGLISGNEAVFFPQKSREANEAFAEFVMLRHNSGKTNAEIINDYKIEYYDKRIKQTGKQPLAAFIANAEAVIPRLIAEFT